MDKIFACKEMINIHYLLQPAKEVWGKAIFYTCLSVILFTGGRDVIMSLPVINSTHPIWTAPIPPEQHPPPSEQHPFEQHPPPRQHPLSRQHPPPDSTHPLESPHPPSDSKTHLRIAPPPLPGQQISPGQQVGSTHPTGMLSCSFVRHFRKAYHTFGHSYPSRRQLSKAYRQSERGYSFVRVDFLKLKIAYEMDRTMLENVATHM